MKVRWGVKVSGQCDLSDAGLLLDVLRGVVRPELLGGDDLGDHLARGVIIKEDALGDVISMLFKSYVMRMIMS